MELFNIYLLMSLLDDYLIFTYKEIIIIIAAWARKSA